MLVLAVGLALAGAAAFIQFAAPAFVSRGQMIVSIKLNIQQGSLYTEELGNFLGTQAALMQGSEVQQRARDRVTSQNPRLTPLSRHTQRQRAAEDDDFHFERQWRKSRIHEGISSSVHG